MDLPSTFLLCQLGMWKANVSLSALPVNASLTVSSFCRLQPVYVVDVAAAIIAALKDDGTSMGKVYELGGPEILTVHELVTSPILLHFFQQCLGHIPKPSSHCRQKLCLT